MSYYLSGALSSQASASAVQVLTGAANGSSNYRQYDWQGLSISPNGEYIIQGTLYGTGGYDPSNETTSFDPELVIWKSSSVGGFSPTTTIKMKGNNNLNHINTRFDGDNMAGSMWLDDQTIAHAVITHDPQGATYAAAPNTKTSGGAFMIITGSDANWSVTTHITGVYGNPQYASQVYAPGSSQRSQPQMMFQDAGPFLVEPNHKHTDATSTRIACFTTNQMADGSLSAYAAQRITIFSGSGGSWSFHSQFDVVGAANSPTENLQDHADNDFPAPQGGEYYVQDVTWIEEDIIAVVFHRKSNGGNKSYLYILKFDSSNGEWHVMDPDGSASTTADSGYKKASMSNVDARMAHASNGIRFVEWDPYSKRLITIKDTELLIYNSGSDWIDSFNDSSTDFSDATETFDLHDKTIARHGPFESPNGIRWRFRSGSTDIISLNTDDGESSANIQTKNTIAWASSGSSGWADNLNTTEGTFGAFTSTQISTGSFNLEIGNGGDSGNTYDAANVLVASRLSAYGTPQCEFLAWNTLAGGDGNTFIYREGSDTEHFKDSGRVVVLNLNAYPGEGDTTAPTISSVAITSATNSQNNTLNEGDVVSVTVTFDEAVTVNTSGGTPAIAISVGGVSRSAAYSSGTGTTAIVFTYTIASSETADTDGISIGANAISLNSGTIQDAAGNNATITHSAVSANSSFKVDTDKPTISSLSVAANNSTVTVTFSEDVYTNSNGTGDLAAADFTLGLSGGNAESIDLDATPSEVSKTSQSIYVLTLNGTNLGSNAAGTETLSVDAASNTAIYDLAGNAHTAAASTVSLNDTATLANAVTETVGTSGGTVSAGGTNAAPVAQAVFPNGCLSENVSVTIDTADDSEASAFQLAHLGQTVSNVIRFTPHGTTFSSPVTVTIRLKDGAPTNNLTLLKRNSDTGIWYDTQISLTVSSGTVSFTTTSFSDYIIIGGNKVARTKISNFQLARLEDHNKVIASSMNLTASENTVKGALTATERFLVQATSGESQVISASAMATYFATAVNPTHIQTTDADGTNTAHRITFTDSNTTDTTTQVFTDGGLTYNPDSNALTAGSLVLGGGISGATTVVASGDVTVGGHLVADADEAKNIFAAVTTAGNAITIGGGGKVVAAGDLQVNGGDITGPTDGSLTISADTDLIFKIDSDGDGTETFQFQNGAGTEIAELNEDGDLQIDGDLTVSGGKITLTNGSIIDSETSNELQLTEDLVIVTGDLKVEGEGVQDAAGAERISLADAMVLKDSNAAAVVTLHATDLSTTFAGGVVVSGDLTVQGTTTTVDSTTIMISQSFTFEGPADDHETTLHAGTPIADSTVNLPALAAGTYHLPVLADAATAASAVVTAAEFALLDGGSTVSTLAVADGDGVLFNDDGTMKQVSVESLSAYFDDKITAMPNLASVGTLTTLTVDNVIVNGTTIGHTSDTDLITLANGVVTVAGTLTGSVISGSFYGDGSELTGVKPTTSDEDAITTTNEDYFIAFVSGSGFTAGVNNATDFIIDSSSLKYNPVTKAITTAGAISATGDVTVGGHLVADANEAKNIFAAVTSNAITIGGGGDVVLGGDLKLATAGKIEDSNGDVRFTATHGGATILHADNGDAGLTLAANNSSVTVAGDLVVSGNDLSFANGATIANGDANTLTITEATLAVSADLNLGGHLVADADEAKNIFAAVTTPGNAITIGGGADVVLGGDLQLAAAGLINDSNGDVRFTATNGGATILHDDDGDAVVTVHASDLSTTFAGAIKGASTVSGSGEIAGGSLDIHGAADVGSLSIAGAAVSATAAELNIMDGGASDSAVTLADADQIVVNDAGTMKQTAVTSLAPYLAGDGLVAASGKVKIVPISLFYSSASSATGGSPTLTGPGTSLISASLNVGSNGVPLQHSVEVYLNGMLQLLSGALNLSSSAGIVSGFDYQLQNAAGAKLGTSDDQATATHVIFAETIDEDDVVQVKYIQKAAP